MPLNQTVMDVVFNHGLGNNAPKAHRNFNESEALAAGISSKTMRLVVCPAAPCVQLYLFLPFVLQHQNLLRRQNWTNTAGAVAL